MKKKDELLEKNNLLMLATNQNDFDKEIQQLNEIDNLSPNEILDGEKAVQEEGVEVEDVEEVDHNGVELSIQGSDIDEYSDDNGEIHSSSEEEEEIQPGRTVTSKVLKAKNIVNEPKSAENHSFDKFSHLRNDPEFKAFLKEMVDDQRYQSKEKGKERQEGSSKERHKKHRSATATSSDRSAKGTLPGVDNLIDSSNCVVKNEMQVSERPQGEMTVRASMQQRLTKSPSDTTIYSPVLRRINNDDVSLIQKISNFVESIRLDGRRHERDRSVVDETSSSCRHIDQDSDVR